MLFVTGIRGAADADANRDRNYNEAIHLTIDGLEIVPDYVGPHDVFAGLDQINARIPRRLSGRGQVNLSVTATGSSASNSATIEFGGSVPAGLPQVRGFNTTTVLAGDELTINGTGFSPNLGDNTVEIIDSEALAVTAQVISASATQLKVRAPFGAGSGHVKVSVRTPSGEQSGASTMPLNMRTSISGFVQDNQRQPIGGLTMRVRASATHSIEARTNAEGSFILPDVQPNSTVLIEVDGGTTPANLPLPTQLMKMYVRANRDNPFPSAIELTPAFSQPVSSSSSFAAASISVSAALSAPETAKILQSDGITLEIPDSAVVRYPDGTINEELRLTAFGRGRTPTNLPVGHFSTRLAQILPFRANITPGGKLTFPNSDRFPGGMQARLFRFDQTLNSKKLGSFIEAGIATVSADGQRVETDANAIEETSYYFVSIPRPTTTLVGRVQDSDGRATGLAMVQARGQSTFTDGLGGFILRQVPVIETNDQVAVEVSFLRATGRVERSQSANVTLTPGGITAVPSEIVLPSLTINRAPVILGPVSVTANQGETRDFGFVASDPDTVESLQVSISGPNFARIIRENNDAYILRLAPGSNDGGNYTATLTVIDNNGVRTTQNISLRINRLPQANAQTVTTGEGVGKAITLTGSDADGDRLSFLIVSNPTQGSLSGTAPNLLYTPVANYSGSDSFTFKVDDGQAGSNVATVAITITQSCSYSISPANVSVPASGGNGSINVITSGGCSWTASGNPSWITITSGSSGSGNGTVNYTIAANTTASPRSGTVTIAGQTFNVNQAGATCNYSISPANKYFSASAESGSVTVTAGSGCSWAASSNVPWITITSGSSGSGNGAVTYTVAANTTTSPRNGTVTIAGQTFTVNQAGSVCIYSITPSTTSVPASGNSGTITITVTTTPGTVCPWQVINNVPWIQIQTGYISNTSGSVNYTVEALPRPFPRTGTLMIADQTFTVKQGYPPIATGN